MSALTFTILVDILPPSLVGRNVAYANGMTGMYLKANAATNPTKSLWNRLEAIGLSSTKVGPAYKARSVVAASKKFRAMKTESNSRSLRFTLERSKDIRYLVSLSRASAILSLNLFRTPEGMSGRT